jgi:hypothetical protein
LFFTVFDGNAKYDPPHFGQRLDYDKTNRSFSLVQFPHQITSEGFGEATPMPTDTFSTPIFKPRNAT